MERGAGLSGRSSLGTGVDHFIYGSVACPAPVMKDYIAVRIECETALRASGLCPAILRPWYILGPGHWRPVVLLPLYRLMELVPPKSSAQRIALMTIGQMLQTLVWAVEDRSVGIRIIEVPKVRRLTLEGP